MKKKDLILQKMGCVTDNLLHYEIVALIYQFVSGIRAYIVVASGSEANFYHLR